MGFHHVWRTFKLKRAYAVLDSLANSPAAAVLAMLAGIGMLALALTCVWAINYYLVVNEYLPPLNSKRPNNIEGDAVIYCMIELIAMIVLGVICTGICVTVEETIAKLRTDLKKYDIEAAQYLDKRQS
ncbi:Hypothetical protein PACV_392 [Pacmanvirus A23]|uniref:Hypothetical protein n=1 Tax=Pacmanvirus A23 TaxID=1932881 RepID=UPI000A095528|nr:Hypothetical protein B9W72_gp388 [Pacmanvirus A23]SIP86105.1 Hypothetical protein PACV_392 [Pacmanvirus A23]